MYVRDSAALSRLPNSDRVAGSPGPIKKISADVACRNSYGAAEAKHHVGIVLANAGAKLQRIRCQGVHTRAVRFILERLEYVLPEPQRVLPHFLPTLLDEYVLRFTPEFDG